MTIQQSSKSNISLPDLPAYDLENLMNDESGKPISKGGVACPFPWRLHECLDAVEREGLEHIVAWQSHGRSFTVFQPKVFTELVMPRFFGQTRFASFQRQLNIYGFGRFTQGKDKGGYFHLCFVREHRQLVRKMKRKKIKGVKSGAPVLPPVEYDFYHPAWDGHFASFLPPGLAVSWEPEAAQERPVSRVYSRNVLGPTLVPLESKPLIVKPKLCVAPVVSLPKPCPSAYEASDDSGSLMSILDDDVLEGFTSVFVSDTGTISEECNNVSAFSDDEHTDFAGGDHSSSQDSDEVTDDDISLFGGALDDIFVGTPLSGPARF